MSVSSLGPSIIPTMEAWGPEARSQQAWGIMRCAPPNDLQAGPASAACPESGDTLSEHCCGSNLCNVRIKEILQMSTKATKIGPSKKHTWVALEIIKVGCFKKWQST